MKKQKVFSILTIILMLTGSLVYAQKDIQSTNSKFIEEYKVLIKEKMQTNHIVGVGAALILGDTVWKEGFGYADKEKQIPFTTQTALPIGSITKPFTGMGIMQLQEKKILDIDKPLVKYLPEFSIKTRETDIKEVTVKSVLQHTSGIPNDIFLNAMDENEKYTDVVGYLKNEYLAYQPNLVVHYSNLGYSLLGHTILKVSGQDYQNYIQDNILKPIGMSNSGYINYSKLTNVSKTYDKNGTYFPIKYGRNAPAGALLSTIDDMVKFAQELIAIYNGKRGGFLKPETLWMFDEINNGNIQISTCVFGWGVNKDDSNLVIGHAGSHHVAVAEIAINLKKKMAGVFLVNTDGGLNLTAEALEKVSELSMNLINQSIPVQNINNSSTNISVDSIKKHVGIYVDTRTSQVVKLENDKLVLNSVLGNFELKPLTSNEFLLGRIYPDSVKWAKKPRYIFTETNGFKLMYYQNSNNTRLALGHIVKPQEITEIWKTRLGIYKREGHKMESADTFSEAELFIGDNDLLQLKVFYTSGEYLYNLRIENDNELIFCGFGMDTSGETLSFSKEGQNDIMKLYGLKMKKTL